VSLVSIITCFLNAQPFLTEAIESVLGQSYSEWELLLVDDGSHDGSTEVAQQFAKTHKRIRYFEHAGHVNLGKATSRNIGIKEAKGDYIVFLDADDVFEPEKLQHQVELLVQNHDVDVVYGRTLYWNSWNDSNARDEISRIGYAPRTVVSPPHLLTAFLKNGGIVPCLCSPLIGRQILDRVGGFDESIQYLFEDQVLLAKLCLEATVFIDDFCGEKYRQHESSTSHEAIRMGAYHPWKLNESERRYTAWLIQYVAQRGIDDPTLQQSLHRAALTYRYPRLFSVIRPFLYTAKCIREMLLPVT
jgi:glycosyltransferase involved in cell wall biosynthesis